MSGDIYDHNGKLVRDFYIGSRPGEVAWGSNSAKATAVPTLAPVAKVAKTDDTTSRAVALSALMHNGMK